MRSARQRASTARKHVCRELVRDRYPDASAFRWAHRRYEGGWTVYAHDQLEQTLASGYRTELEAWEAALIEVYGEQDYL